MPDGKPIAKPLRFLPAAKREYDTLPEEVQDVMGHDLWEEPPPGARHQHTLGRLHEHDAPPRLGQLGRHGFQPLVLGAHRRLDVFTTVENWTPSMIGIPG